MAGKKLILLDRDGVINRLRHDYVKDISEFELIDGSISAIQNFLNAGFNVAVCSNQRGVALKIIHPNVLDEIEETITEALGLRHFSINYYYCVHLKKADCGCRKPLPGLIKQAIKDYNVSVEESIFVGDNITDYQAAQAIGMDFALVLTGYGPETDVQIPPIIPRYSDLQAFSQRIPHF